MRISLLSFNPMVKNNKLNVSSSIKNNLSPLKQDTVSFKAKKWNKNKRHWDIQDDLRGISDPIEIFDYFDIKAEKRKDGKLIISHYKPLDKRYFPKRDLKIDEEKLLKEVVEIKGNADFKNSQETKLTNLKSIDGNAKFYDSKTNVPNLKTIGGFVSFSHCENMDISSLESVEGDVDFCRDFNGAVAPELNNLKYIGGDLNTFSAASGYIKINGLPNLKINSKFYFYEFLYRQINCKKVG